MDLPIYVTEEFVIMMAIPVLVLVFVAYFYVKRDRAYRAMGAVSKDFGLVDSSPGIWKWPSAYGTVEGRQIEIQTQQKSVGTKKRLMTTFRVQLGADVPDKMGIATEGLAESLGKVFGRRDIEVGVASFDRRFLVKGPGRQFGQIRNLLSVPANREAVRNFFELSGETYIEDACGYVVKSGMIADEDVLRDTVRGCISFAENFGSGELPESHYDRIANAMKGNSAENERESTPEQSQAKSKNDWWG
ncbi:MAG: hypothetical protein ACQEVA_04175 [Myxococcota bacterium]